MAATEHVTWWRLFWNAHVMSMSAEEESAYSHVKGEDF